MDKFLKLSETEVRCGKSLLVFELVYVMCVYTGARDQQGKTNTANQGSSYR